MGESAQVSSIAAIEEFRRALCVFAQHVAQSLCDLELATRRAFDELAHDRLKYWQAEIQRGSRALVEAKNELQLAQTMRRMDDYTPSCLQERKKVERLKQRVQFAEDKATAVRRWGSLLAREIDDFKIRSAQLATMLEADVPKALAVLDRVLQSLTAYIQLQSPALAPPANACTKSPLARPEVLSPETSEDELARCAVAPSPQDGQASPSQTSMENR